MKPLKYDDILKKIDKLPDKWNEIDEKINLQITVHQNEASWVLKKIFDNVDRGLIHATIKAKPSKYSIELEIIIYGIIGIIAAKSINLFLEELKNYLKKQWKIKQRNKKIQNN